MEDIINLSRWQFALTTVYHFLFVPLTIGMAWFLVFTESLYVKTNDKRYLELTKFWKKIFLVSFSIGVATGLVQEFQFGMNWSEYSKFMGDIFGVPLALEALLAFFIESTFIGLWVFGWDRLSAKAHAACIWIVAISSTISAYFILVANSFMQNPVAYQIRNGRAELDSILDLLLNPHLFYQFPHVIVGAICTAAFFIGAISIWLYRKDKYDDTKSFIISKSIKIAAIVGFISAVLATQTGHFQTIEVFENQPMKMAAAEGLYETDNTGGLSMFSILDEENRKTTFSIKIPYALNLLLHMSLEGTVKGINDLQKEDEAKYGPSNYIPPVTISFWSFRIMVFSGSFMILISAIWLFGYFKMPKLLKHKYVYMISLFSLALPFIANSSGWILTEMGRQPWIVQGLFTTKDAISPSINASDVIFSILAFSVVYIFMIIVGVKMMITNIKEVD